MALAAALAELQAQARCPVCLEPLWDPVTLNCGHNCCAPCLRQRWAGLLDVLPCPVCQHHCPSRAVPRNPLLAALADLLRPLAPASRQGARLGEEEEEEALCARHPRAPALFCEEDLELLCGLCVASAPHRGHRLVPAERAAAGHREALKGRLELLGRHLEVAERGFALQVSRIWSLREQMNARRSELYFEFAQFRRFLDKEQNDIDIRVLRKMAAVCGRVRESRNRVWELGSSLRNLLGAVNALCPRADAELLGGVASVQYRWPRSVSLEAPAACSHELKMTFSFPPHHIGLENMISRFQADLTLDPETAHRRLFLCADRKSAAFTFERMGLDSAPRPRAFTSHQAVLGAEAFQAGRHFWQVDIRGSGMLSLGVCRESFPRSILTPPGPSHGCWQLQRPTGLDRDPPTAGIHFWVFLDSDLGVISFYSLENRTHLHTLTGDVADRLLPYFSAGPCSLSFSLTLVTDAC